MALEAYNTRQAAHNGARLLDRLIPTWYMLINTDTLSLKSGDNCILGQLNPSVNKADSFYSGWSWAYENLEDCFEYVDKTMGFMTRNGFCTPGPVLGSSPLWPLLDMAWLIEIADRREVTV